MKLNMRHIVKTILLSICLLFSAYTFAQSQPTDLVVNGRVTDTDGNPVSGVIVKTGNNINSALTDMEGAYSMTLPDQFSGQLTFISNGYKTGYAEISHDTDAPVDVVMKPSENYDQDELMHLGFTVQRKGDISGAVSAVSGKELERSPVSSLSMTLAGRLPGLFTQESYSEPGRTTTNLFVRGISSIRANQPVVVIDGMIISYNATQTFDYISAEEIESVTLLKDAASLALYGIQGAEGVLVITTKRGHQGKMKLGIKVEQTFQKMSTTPSYFGSAEYAKLRNQAAANDNLGDNYYFSQSQIQGFESGANRDLYPDNDWRDTFLKNFSNTQRVGLDVSGGSDKVLYYSNVNLMHQGGSYNTDQPDYDSNNNFLWANIRSNVDVKINRYLSSSLRLAGNIKRERTPGGGFMGDIYPHLFTIPSSVYGPVTPTTDQATGGGVIVTDKEQATPYGLINRSGFTNHTVTNIYAQFALDLDMGFITEGLSANGFVAYQTNSVNSLVASQTYEKWIQSNPNSLDFVRYGSDVNSDLSYSKASSMYYQLSYQGKLNYARNFGKHGVGTTAFLYYQNMVTDNNTMPYLLPYRKVGSGFEATYNYDRRYYVKFDLGYSGSEQFMRGNRFFTTPAVSGAWVVSNEQFMADLTWLNELKFRASYGKTATDRSGLGRFIYMDNVALGPGGYIPALGYVVTETQYANTDIAAEISKKLNIGVDLGLFDNISLSVDIFNEKMDNMVIPGTSSQTSYQGLPFDALPSINAGSFENKGYEIGLHYAKAFHNGLYLKAGGFLTHAENKVINGGETLKASDYKYRKWQEGYSYGQEFGYLVNYANGSAYYNTPQEITQDNLYYEIGNPGVGDLRYTDLNGDGIINEKDKAPIGTGLIPRNYYAFYVQAEYKSFDLSVMFQGVGKYSTTFSGAGIYEYTTDGEFGSLHRNAWTQERYTSGQQIDYPSLSTQKNSNHETSDFFLYDRSYLRLKNLEIGYTLPQRWASAISAEKLRISVSGQNLICWDKMKSNDFGPEGSYSAIPVYKFYNIKLNLNF